LGQWEEDGLLYTYTQRRDLPSHECFVGEADAKAGLFLMEAGVNCRRGLAVSQFGMQLTKKSKSNNFYGADEKFTKYIYRGIVNGRVHGICNCTIISWIMNDILQQSNQSHVSFEFILY
jgi:hypothetical protein